MVMSAVYVLPRPSVIMLHRTLLVCYAEGMHTNFKKNVIYNKSMTSGKVGLWVLRIMAYGRKNAGSPPNEFEYTS